VRYGLRPQQGKPGKSTAQVGQNRRQQYLGDTVADQSQRMPALQRIEHTRGGGVNASVADHSMGERAQVHTPSVVVTRTGTSGRSTRLRCEAPSRPASACDKSGWDTESRCRTTEM